MHSGVWLSICLSLLAVGVLTGTPVSRTDNESVGVVKISARNTQQTRARGENGSAPYRIATGLFIHSLSFTNPSDVNITGYLWQLYPPGYPSQFRKGVSFPEEVNADSTVFRQHYRKNSEQGELFGWYFDVTLRQSFDYSNYPLDRHTIWLRLWPAEGAEQETVILEPDLAAYEDTQGRTFGLDADIVPGEWEIDEVFFSYNTLQYDTNFGFRGTPVSRARKEFHYNLVVKRKFINAFVVNLAPLLVVAMLLYAALLTCSANPAQGERFGFSPMVIVSVCSALFFVVMMAHVRVRSLFSESGLVYLEYYYLVMYVALFLVVVNAYLLVGPRSTLFRLLHYRDNLIPKLTYWPVLLWTLALVTRVKLQY